MERASCRGVAWVVILFQETRELIPIEPTPACPQAGEKFEFAARENRHKNALDCLWGFAPKHRVFAHGRARDRPTSRPRSGQLELNRVFRLIVVNGSSRPQSLRTYSASSAEIANLDSSPGPSLGTGEFIEPMDGTGGSDQDQVTTSFAFQRIACRCRGQHGRPSAYIALSLPGTSGACLPARWNRACRRLHMRCRCEGLQPCSLPACIYKSALHQTTCSTCRSFWWLTRL